MSTFSRLIGMASKALDKGSAGPRQEGGSDWRGMVRSAADALTGDSRPVGDAARTPPTSVGAPAAAPGLTPPPAGTRATSQIPQADKAAIARYDYLMQTADPHQIERIHAEAFARLTPAQRTLVEQRMRTELPPHERPASSSAPDLARAAARTEAASPGRVRGLLSRVGRGAAVAGVGGAAVGVLGVVAGGAVLSSVAGPLLEQAGSLGVDFDSLAEGVDLGGVAEGALGGVADHVGGWSDQLGNVDLPGLGDIFGR
ncbi:MAG: cation-transporting ATPase [Microbacterium sp.]